VEGALHAAEPSRLAFVIEDRYVGTPRVAERRHKQVHLDPLAGDRHCDLAEVDLQLLARRGLVAHGGDFGCPQFTTKRRDRALDRTQTNRDSMLPLQILAHHIGVAAMLLQPLVQPRVESLQRASTHRPLVRNPTVAA
jgi:hypothetical protein